MWVGYFQNQNEGGIYSKEQSGDHIKVKAMQAYHRQCLTKSLDISETECPHPGAARQPVRSRVPL